MSDNCIIIQSTEMDKKGFKLKKELFISSSKTKNIKDDYEYVR